MAKQYKVKDINNNGKIDGWEQGKYDAINNSATEMYKKEKSPMKMGYAMKMGSKENYSPTNFKTKDAMLMGQSPMMNISSVNSIKQSSNLRYSDGSVQGDSYGLSAQYGGDLGSLTVDTSGLGSQKSDYTKAYLKGMEYGQNKKKIDRKVKKKERVENKAANKAARIENRLAKTQKKGEKATEAGKLQKARRLQKRKQRLLKK